MRLIKGSLGGLVLAGILAMMPAAAFAHGGGGAEEARTSRVQARASLGLISLPGRATVFIAISTTEMGVS